MKVAVGADIGGTSIKAAVVSVLGTLKHDRILPTRSQDTPEDTVTRLADALGGLLLEAARIAGVEPRNIPVGIGCAGLIDTSRGIVQISPNLPHWRDVPLGAMLAERLGSPVLLINDANAFVLGEGRAGAGRGARVLLGLTLGTGVGGGILLDGELFTGVHGWAGEMGHTPLQIDGEKCACGSYGCLEGFVGNREIVLRYMELAGGEPTQILKKFLKDPSEQPTPETLSLAARAGDAPAIESFRQTGRYLGAALAGFVNIFDPDRIVLGGGVAQAGELILKPAREMMEERMMFPQKQHPELCLAALGPHAAVIGASLEALNRVGKNEFSGGA
ncbi:MAG: ROK family protein [Candidatus Eisenbacteria bacterium]|uniref:ROK family protein n=1 Tax=Eiseniibacteriota bacterium TaxID=2212470 RepID=A0A948W287_UNCEI|nr:ROK family protein [Candidatus Eisenbacteria bacterium]MBU1949279.1 ROK family protein [Candidatus Eisenbacteria bacterium]MBU2689677.1 ROK family protein [Candidatus Eisenbacteria bacterium]